MANVHVKTTGGNVKSMSASTIEELRKQLGLSGQYIARLNKEDAGDGDELHDDDFVVFAKNYEAGAA